jgi:hypothetical protein
MSGRPAINRSTATGGGEMNASDLKPGIIVRGPVLPDPVEVLVVTPLGDVIKIEGAGHKTRQVHQRVPRLEAVATWRSLNQDPVESQ